jgi:hypothetical protein
METISNIRSAVFGGNAQEPVSGEQGAGTKTAPYDKGNEDVSAIA